MVLVSRLGEVNFAPASELDEIAQNVRCILATVAGSVCLDRDFGIDADLLDQPTPRAVALLQANIIGAVREIEPRARVSRVRIGVDGDGVLTPEVEIRIAG